MKILILFVSLYLLVSCSSLPEMTSPEAKFYATKCGSCHSPAHPGRHSAEQWDEIVLRMNKEMKYKGLSPLTLYEHKRILSYLKKHAR